MKITFLGTGSSLGTPITGCTCDVCRSTDIRDKRLRASIMIDIDNKTFIIDAGPDFRQQMLLYNQKFSLDAILITHDHRDHIAGLDDVRPFNFLQKRSTPIYAEKNVIETIKSILFYSFEQTENENVPKFILNEISTEPFEIQGVKVITIRVFHSMQMLGFRIGDFTYITDAKIISDTEIEKIKGTKILVVNALRQKEHYSHFTLDEAINFIKKVNPQQAYLTHMSHRIGFHKDLCDTLPSNIFPAFDGQEIIL